MLGWFPVSSWSTIVAFVNFPTHHLPPPHLTVCPRFRPSRLACYSEGGKQNVIINTRGQYSRLPYVIMRCNSRRSRVPPSHKQASHKIWVDLRARLGQPLREQPGHFPRLGYLGRLLLQRQRIYLEETISSRNSSRRKASTFWA